MVLDVNTRVRYDQRGNKPKTVLCDENAIVPPDGEVHDPVVEIAAEELADDDSDLRFMRINRSIW